MTRIGSPVARGLRPLLAAAGVAALLLAGAACGGSDDSGDEPATATGATTAAATATTATTAAAGGCPDAAEVSADLGIPGLEPVADPASPTPTATLVCLWQAGTIGTDGGATVRYIVDEPGDEETARSGFEYSRQTLGSCVRTDTCDPGDDVEDDVLEGDANAFVTTDVSTSGSDTPFYSTVIIAAANDGAVNCSLAVNLGSAERATVLAPVRPALEAAIAYCNRR